MALSDTDYIIYHGIKLAENSFVVNCEIESLDQDPTVTRAGRIWFNTSERLFKYSGLDVDGTITIRTFSSMSGLTEYINALSSTEAGKGASLIGYEGVNTTGLVIPPSSIKSALDILIQEINNLKIRIDSFIPSIDEFISDSTGIVSFNLSKKVISKNKLTVLVNGLEQGTDDYILTHPSPTETSINLQVYSGDKVKVINFEIS